MRTVCGLVVLGFAIILSCPERRMAAAPQGTKNSITFAKGYPKPGAKKGDITVKGTIVVNLPAAAVTAGTGQIVITPVGGGPKQTKPITVPTGENGTVSWEGTISGLTGSNYNVTVEIDIEIGNRDVTWSTDPKQAKPK